jgi:hypothetical protein
VENSTSHFGPQPFLKIELHEFAHRLQCPPQAPWNCFERLGCSILCDTVAALFRQGFDFLQFDLLRGVVNPLHRRFPVQEVVKK